MSDRPIIIDGPGEYYLRGGGTATITKPSTDLECYDWTGISEFLDTKYQTVEEGDPPSPWHWQSNGSFEIKESLNNNSDLISDDDIIGKVSKTFISTQPRYMATL